MNSILAKLLGLNYRTTILGVGVIVAAIGRVGMAWRNRDFMALANDGQLIAETVTALLAGVGLFIAKDSSVIGAGGSAKTVASDGTVTNVAGATVGQQPSVESVVNAQEFKDSLKKDDKQP